MHNFALFLLNGEGGERDLPQAARWLKRAADLGVVDAEHNLGLLYEAGRGVEKNLAEAYRWQVIAANAGDLESRERALALEPRLTPTERAAVQAKAAAFRPGAGGPAADGPLVAPAVTLAGAQALLARSGYYVGPTDGAPDPRYAAAAAAYLKDHPEARP
jgi:TPR repeat protein